MNITCFTYESAKQQPLPLFFSTPLAQAFIILHVTHFPIYLLLPCSNSYHMHVCLQLHVSPPLCFHPHVSLTSKQPLKVLDGPIILTRFVAHSPSHCWLRLSSWPSDVLRFMSFWSSLCPKTIGFLILYCPLISSFFRLSTCSHFPLIRHPHYFPLMHASVPYKLLYIISMYYHLSDPSQLYLPTGILYLSIQHIWVIPSKGELCQISLI